MNAEKVVEMLYSEMVYYVVQYNYVGKFDIAPCSKHIKPNFDEGNDKGWTVASGPYDSVDIAGKVLALAYESYDLGSYNVWNEAREDLADSVNDSVYVEEALDRNGKDVLAIDPSELMQGILKLLKDWDTG